MKVAIAMLLGLVLGITAGAVGVHQWLMPQLAAAESGLLASQRDLERMKSDGAAAADKLARLEQEREAYNARLEAAEARAEQAATRAAVAPAAPEFALDVAVGDGSLETPDAPGDPRPEEGREGGRDRGDRWGGSPEERDARRQEFVTRMEDNLTNFFTGELEKSGTPAMQERLLALEEKTYEMFALRGQMREAETDEQREQLRQAYGEAMDSTRQLMAEQQQDMLNAIASQFGIAGASDQAAFQQAVRSAVSSPFFTDNPSALLWNSGRSDDGGGPGRFGGGGFGGGFRGGPGGR